MLRSHFARTYGCLSICHYILGIGDRHLSNMMVDLQSGGVVGIDFGHAFGSATQVRKTFPMSLSTFPFSKAFTCMPYLPIYLRYIIYLYPLFLYDCICLTVFLLT